jgi:hypothetical protein
MAKKKNETPLIPVNPEVFDAIAAATQGTNTTFVPGRGTVVTMKDLPKDDVTRIEVGKMIMAVRDTQGFPNITLSRRMEEVWGAFTWIETGTDKDNGFFLVYKGNPKVRTKVKVNRSGTQNLVNFSLAVPLGILELRPTSDRQWNLLAEEVIVPDGPPVFMFNVVKRESVERNLKDELEEQGGATGEAAAEATATAAAPAKAVKGKGAAKKGKGSAQKAKADPPVMELDDDLDEEFEDEDE